MGSPTLRHKECTSYSLLKSNIPLAPPLVEINGKVLKTLADRTVSFCTDGRSLCRPEDIFHTYRGLSSVRSGWVGTQNLPPFQGVFIENGHSKTMRFKTSSYRTYRTTVPTKTPSMFLLQTGKDAGIHYRTSFLITSTCTSDFLKPTTIPLAPPLVEINGKVLKTLADRTVSFCTDGRSLCRPEDIFHTYRGLSSVRSGWVGTQNLPPFQGVFIENGHSKTMRFKTSSYRISNYSSYKNTFDVFATNRKGRWHTLSYLVPYYEYVH